VHQVCPEPPHALVEHDSDELRLHVLGDLRAGVPSPRQPASENVGLAPQDGDKPRLGLAQHVGEQMPEQDGAGRVETEKPPPQEGGVHLGLSSLR